MTACQAFYDTLSHILWLVGEVVRARDRLAQLIAASGMSQAEVARRVGEHPTWVNNRLRGVADIKADDVPRLAAALGVPAAAFFEEPSPPSDADQRALADVLSRLVLRLIQELPAGDRATLLGSAGSQPKPTEQAGTARREELHRDIAVRATRRLARSWEDLPEEEQQLIWEMIEARRRVREEAAERESHDREPTNK